MRATFCFFMILLLSTCAYSQPPTILWETFHGGSSWESASALGLQSDGTILVVGETEVYPGSGWDTNVLWLDDQGNLIQSATSGISYYGDFGRCLVVNPDDSFVVGGYTRGNGESGVYLAKMEPDGSEPIWFVEQTLVNSIEYVIIGNVIDTPDGGYLIGGTYTEFMYVTPEHAFFWKVDADGVTEWFQDYERHIVVSDLAVRPEGGYYVAGGLEDGQGESDAWLCHMGETGQFINEYTFPVAGRDALYSMIVATNGGVVCAGYCHLWQARVVEIDNDGNLLWDTRYGDDYVANAILEMPSGSFAVAGMQSIGAYEYYAMLSKIGADGQLLWHHAEGDTYDKFSYQDLALRPDGGLIAAGAGFDPADPYNQDYYVVRYAPEDQDLPLTVSLTPHTTEIPAQGGILHFDLSARNWSTETLDVWFWSAVVLPDGTEISPLDQLQQVFTPELAFTVNNLPQLVPAWAPAGEYRFIVNLGYLDGPYAYDSFTFTKLGQTGTGGGVEDWTGNGLAVIGSEDQASLTGGVVLPECHALSPAYPNPFNATTTLQVMLPNAAEVSVDIYNTMGQRVAVLAQGQYGAGTHSLSFDATDLSSGIYFVAMRTGEFSQTRKLVLMK